MSPLQEQSGFLTCEPSLQPLRYFLNTESSYFCPLSPSRAIRTVCIHARLQSHPCSLSPSSMCSVSRKCRVHEHAARPSLLSCCDHLVLICPFHYQVPSELTNFSFILLPPRCNCHLIVFKCLKTFKIGFPARHGDSSTGEAEAEGFSPRLFEDNLEYISLSCFNTTTTHTQSPHFMST